MNQPIGIIDSGVGGLTVASVLVKKLPKEPVIYLGDSINCPYGDKTQEEILQLSKTMIDFLLTKNIKLLVVACNTITVSAIDQLRKAYPALPIVGIVPVLKTAAEKTRSGRIGVFATKATADSQYQRDLINRFARDSEVLSVGSSTLVPLIEKRDFDGVDEVLAKELEEFKSTGIDTLALGCSHFPLISEKIQRILPQVKILDSADAVTRQVERILKNNDILSDEKKSVYHFFTTGDTETMKYFIDRLFGKIDYKAEKVSLV